MRSIVFQALGTWLVVVTLTAAGLAAAVGYGLTAPKRYRATAQLLVLPAPVGDPTYAGLDVLRDVHGKHSAAASVAARLRSPQIALGVRRRLGLATSGTALLSAVRTHVVATSDLVAVTAQDGSATGATRLANAFADEFLARRIARFQHSLIAAIGRDAALLLTEKVTSGGVVLEKRLATLRGLQGASDPTLHRAGRAVPPTSAAWPKLWKLAVLGAAGGLAVGIFLALLLSIRPLRPLRRRPPTAGAEGVEPGGVEPGGVETGGAETGGAETGGAETGVRPGRWLLGRQGLSDRRRLPDRRLPDRVIDWIERRNDRIAAIEAERERLEAERERLAGDVAALDVREREVTAKLDELRKAARLASDANKAATMIASAANKDATDRVTREATLQGRVAALTQREIGLARRVAALAARERAAEERAEELARWARELTIRADELWERSEEARRRAGEDSVLTPEPRSPQPPVSEAAAAAPHSASFQPSTTAVAAVPAATSRHSEGRWNLMVLERLVNDRGDAFPDRQEEWWSYLYYLREYADADGSLPADFDLLIENTFAELVS